YEVGVDPRGMHETDGDAEVRHFLAVGQREHFNPGLACGVGGQPGNRGERYRRRHHHGVASTALQVRCRVLECAENTAHVDVQDALKRCLVGLPHRSIGGDPGVGDNKVDAAHGVCAVVN